MVTTTGVEIVRATINQYRQTSLAGLAEANPYELTAAIFRQVLGNIAAAKGAIQKKDYAAKGDLISKTISLISVLEGSLDHERGGEISANLRDLYLYSNEQLLRASVENNEELLDEVLKLLMPIKEAWDAIPPEEQEKSFFAENQASE